MKSRKFFIFAIIFAYTLIFGQGSYVYAQETQEFENPVIPTFPRCENPQGTIKVSYSSGTHGIPGSSATNTGSDDVYTLSESTLTQCFCTDNGDGTQTNWWKVSSLTLDQIELLLSQGWVYIPDGSLWGLQEDPYLARNRKYECDKDEGKDGHLSDDGDRADKKDNDGGIGSVLGINIGGQVLGLATTGNIGSFYLFFGTGLASTALLSIILIKKKK